MSQNYFLSDIKKDSSLLDIYTVMLASFYLIFVNVILYKLIYVCEQYAAEFDVKFNGAKS